MVGDVSICKTLASSPVGNSEFIFSYNLPVCQNKPAITDLELLIIIKTTQLTNVFFQNVGKVLKRVWSRVSISVKQNLHLHSNYVPLHVFNQFYNIKHFLWSKKQNASQAVAQTFPIDLPFPVYFPFTPRSFC